MKRIAQPTIPDIATITAALWQEIDATDRTHAPYVGLQSAVARQMQKTRQAIGKGIRQRNIEIGIALMTSRITERRAPPMRNNTGSATATFGCGHYTTYALRRALFGAAGSTEDLTSVNGSGTGGRWAGNAGAEGPRPYVFENKENSSRKPAAAHSPGDCSSPVALWSLFESAGRGRPDIITPVWILVKDP